ncbi:MAG: hypothetical protein ABL933_17140 [Methyloglobulus sp.]
MPTTDWNWFFSSVAQSAAAIVGIFGAFIVTKILANQSAFSEKSRRMQELITLGEKLVDATTRLSFDWYHKHDSADEIEALEKLLEKDETDEPESLYKKLNFSPYIARADAIQKIACVKTNRENRLRREREESKRKIEQEQRFGIASAIPMYSNLIPVPGLNSSLHSLQLQLTKKREEIDTMYTEVKHHVHVVSDFHALVVSHPESSSLITASLILILTLFFAGVIYPLSFMPLPTNWKPSLSFSEIPNFLFSLRGVILAIVSILFTTMLAMFFILNIRMRYQQTLLEQLEQYKNLSKYSKYFANRVENAA